MGSIRKIVFDDLKNIYELEKNIFIYSWSKKLVENQLRDQKALNLLSIRNNKILGYVFTKIYLDYIEIERIGVIHDERRKYIGEDLMNEVERITIEKNIPKLTLEVKENNISAINLYKKLNFRKDSIRKKYYQSDNCDAILMSKDLN